MIQFSRFNSILLAIMTSFGCFAPANAQDASVEVQQDLAACRLPSDDVAINIRCLRAELRELRADVGVLTDRIRSAQIFEFPNDYGAAELGLNFNGNDYTRSPPASDWANANALAEVFCKSIGFSNGMAVAVLKVGVTRVSPHHLQNQYNLRSLICHFGAHAGT